MAQRSHATLFSMIAAVSVIAGFFVLVGTNQAVQDFLFKGSGEVQFVVSGDRLAAIVDDLRVQTRSDWQVLLAQVEAQADRAETERDAMFARVAASSLGADYLQELKTFLREKHRDVTGVDGRDGNAPLADVHLAVVEAERRLTNAAIDIIAAQTAIELEVPAIDAADYARVVQPDRRTLDGAVLSAEVRSMGGPLDAFKQQIRVGGSEIDAMVTYAEKVIENLGADDGDLDQGIELAMDVMADGSVGGDTLMPDQVNLDDLGTSDGGFGDALPGRMVSAGALANANIFIDRWYVMGPFENRFRQSIDASFLPEKVVDLDHVTIGKGGKEIRWEYWVSPKLRIEPSHAPQGAVYYGWTQIHVEEAGSYWFSCGSDDYGKMWVNGELIWESSTDPKSFRADEHTGEMQLEAGLNEILFRCENGGGTMGWSLVFHTEAWE